MEENRKDSRKDPDSGPNSGLTSGPKSSKKIIIYAIIGIIAVVAVSLVTFTGSGNNSSLTSLGGQANSGSGTALLGQQSGQVIQDTNSSQQQLQSFRDVFCGNQSEPNSTAYVREIKLPSSCEMPLGITVYRDTVWYISTKQGLLGIYNITSQRFVQEYRIPGWGTSQDSAAFPPQVWALKIDKQGNIWFTDERDTIWKFSMTAKTFEKYVVPSAGGTFGASYPVSLDFDSAGNIYFVGVHSPTLWFGKISEMKNGTSQGLSAIPLPLEGFASIDKDLISTGSVTVDNNRNVVWVTALAFQQKGQIFRYDIDKKTFDVYNLSDNLTSPVGSTLDSNGNLWVTDHGTSTFFKLDPSSGKITEYVTSVASSKIYGGTTPSDAYTLPYWIEKGPTATIWLNEHEGNKIAVFDPAKSTLVEYWIPSQNKFFSKCPDGSPTCGVANALQFSVGENNQVWFSEWTENKIGTVDTQKLIPFSVSTSTQNVTVARGDSTEIKVTIEDAGANSISVKMIASGSFTPNAQFGNSTGTYSEESATIDPGNSKQVSFIFTPARDLKPGQYMMMLGASDDDVSYLKAVTVNVT